MYTLFRRIHLFASVFLTAFLLMYFVSGYVLIHPKWFPRAAISKVVTTSTLDYKLTDTPMNDPVAAGEFVKKSLHLSGQVNPLQQPPAKERWTWHIKVGHPGVAYDIDIKPLPLPATQPTTRPTTQPAANVTVTRYNFATAGTLNGFHRLRGFSGSWVYRIWSVLFDAAAISLILFSLTGIYLWFKLSKKRLWGALTLAFGLGFPVATLIYLAMSK